MARKTQQTWVRPLLLTLLFLMPTLLKAEELEYRMEAGGGLGLDFYSGDANSAPFANMGVMGGFLFRRNFNPRMCLKANLAMGHIYGNTDGVFIPQDANNMTPEGGNPVKLKFSRELLDVGAQFELNFWGYGTGESYKGTSRITPYALMGLGLTLGMGGGAGTCCGLSMPVGVGVKYKVRKRLNIGAEWTWRFSTTDKLDAVSKNSQLTDPYGIVGKGIKNKDSYSFLMFFLTYDFGPKLRRCNN